MFSASARKLFKINLVGAAVGAGYLVSQDEGSRRSFTFWKGIFPIYAHYRFYQFLNQNKIISDEDADKHYEKLHELYSEPVKDIVYSMRGMYLKNAQIMSVQDDFVPKAYMRWVKDTQDNVPSEFKGSEAKEYLRGKMKEELGLDFDDVFSHWDDKPLGVASIGEVHRATLKSTNEVVAVKILCPNMEQRFRSDLATIKSFCKLAMPQHVSGMDEIEKQFVTEFDYSLECKNLTEVRNAMLDRWGSKVVIPRPVEELCSKHMLVMEFLEGEKLADGIRRQYSKIAAIQGKTMEQFENEMKEKIKNGTFNFQSLKESKAQNEKISSYFYWRDLLWGTEGGGTANIYRALYNYSPLSWLYGSWEYSWERAPVDLGEMLELISLVHGDQIFTYGAFNGDPHPGNILLLKDGRLGLIDYGQVKHMSEKERIIFAKLVIAHYRMDKEEVVRISFDEMGAVSKYHIQEAAYLLSAFYLDRDTDDVCQGKNISDFVDWIEAWDPNVKAPEEYIMACRVSLLLRGMGSAFGIKFRMSEVWKEEAEKFLKSRGIDY